MTDKLVSSTHPLNLTDDILDIRDKSNIMRSLLLLIELDKIIRPHEFSIFIDTGHRYGFDKEYCELAIRDVLINPNIGQSLPVFFYKANALEFINTALRIVIGDDDVWKEKVKFIESVAEVNGLQGFWQKIALRRIREKKTSMLLKTRRGKSEDTK